MTSIAGVSRRLLLASGFSTAALFAGATSGKEADPQHLNLPTSRIEDYLRCSPSSDQPAIDYAVITDSKFAGGADPGGNRDSSLAIRAAVASGRPVYLPPGTYNFEGPGIDHPAPFIVGAGQSATTVALGPGTMFIDSNQMWTSLTLRGIRFNGGKGHVRNRFESANVANYYTVSDNAFIDYDGASISNNASDQPYWKIERNIFQAGNFDRSMGIALSGLTDGTTIANNAFLINRVHIKLARGGNNTYIRNCDFLRFGPPQNFPRIDVCFTLSPDEVNCGAGMVLTQCKFGNEFLDKRDYRIVYADEDPGRTNDERWPNLGADSANWVGGHIVRDVLSAGIGDDALIPLVRSMTPNIVGSMYGPITQVGNSGAPIMSVSQPLLNGGQSNHFGPVLRANSDTSPLPELVVSDRR